MSVNIRPLTKELQEKAEKELNEIPTQVEYNLGLYKSWLKKQKHLLYKNDDQLLLNFLRSSKYSLERAKSKLDAYYTFRTLAPEIARDHDPFLPDMQAHLELTTSIPLPILESDPAGPRVLLFRYRDYDPDLITATAMLKGESMNISVLLNSDDNYVIAGTILIYDLGGAKTKTALQCTPTLFKKTAMCFEKAFPTRLKAVYVINVPAVFEPVLNLLKLFLSKKLNKRLHIYSTGNTEEIFKILPKSNFPEEYGGDFGCHEDLRAAWKKTVESYREMLVNENNYCSDESERPGDVHYTADGFFGTNGSFKNMQLD